MNSKKKIRKKFRNETFERDNYKCRLCGADFSSQEHPELFLDAHHITDRNEMPNGGYVKENGISLCKENLDEETGGIVESCHMKAERFHISGGEEWLDGAHPDDLYAMIGSSKELAILMSEKLK